MVEAWFGQAYRTPKLVVSSSSHTASCSVCLCAGNWSLAAWKTDSDPHPYAGGPLFFFSATVFVPCIQNPACPPEDLGSMTPTEFPKWMHVKFMNAFWSVWAERVSLSWKTYLNALFKYTGLNIVKSLFLRYQYANAYYVTSLCSRRDQMLTRARCTAKGWHLPIRCRLSSNSQALDLWNKWSEW